MAAKDDSDSDNEGANYKPIHLFALFNFKLKLKLIYIKQYNLTFPNLFLVIGPSGGAGGAGKPVSFLDAIKVCVCLLHLSYLNLNFGMQH